MNPAVKARAAPKNGGFTLLELLITMAVIMIVSGGVFLTFRQPDRRALDSAMLQLQADARYAQRRALVSGQTYGIIFSRAENMYRIMSVEPNREIRRVYLQNGVELGYSTARVNHQLNFHPRGTPNSGFRVRLYSGRYFREMTVTVAGGRVEFHDTSILQE